MRFALLSIVDSSWMCLGVASSDSIGKCYPKPRFTLTFTCFYTPKPIKPLCWTYFQPKPRQNLMNFLFNIKKTKTQYLNKNVVINYSIFKFIRKSVHNAHVIIAQPVNVNMNRNCSNRRYSVRKPILRNFAKFTGKC